MLSLPGSLQPPRPHPDPLCGDSVCGSYCILSVQGWRTVGAQLIAVRKRERLRPCGVAGLG